MKTRVVRDKKVGEGYTLARTTYDYPVRRDRLYSCWFATTKEAQEYLKEREKAQ